MPTPFHTTSWSLISRTREPGEAAREATAALCQQYWQPLYVYARRAGQSAHQAEDTIQDFFVHVVEHDVFARADADRGRFRTFLLAALQQFMSRQHRDQTRLKRAAPGAMLRLDIESGERAIESLGDLSPSDAFDRAWAQAQLELTWHRVEAEFAAAGKADLCGQLRPVVSGHANISAREIGCALNLTEGAVHVAMHRLRKQFGEVLREQVAQTLESPDEVDDEIAHLRTAFTARRA